MENALEKMDKCILSSLSFLDNKTVFISIVFILFLYNTCLFSNITKYVGNIYEYHVVKVIILLLIIYVSRKSYLIGILLALSFVISLTYNSILKILFLDIILMILTLKLIMNLMKVCSSS